MSNVRNHGRFLPRTETIGNAEAFDFPVGEHMPLVSLFRILAFAGLTDC
jgi:hypothetical protein